uniref:Uncharacterized protein n=1 Tax=Salix viminalis TaxID=40686 RepID=A0A6N2KCT8_SALVM
MDDEVSTIDIYGMRGVDADNTGNKDSVNRSRVVSVPGDDPIVVEIITVNYFGSVEVKLSGMESHLIFSTWKLAGPFIHKYHLNSNMIWTSQCRRRSCHSEKERATTSMFAKAPPCR